MADIWGGIKKFYSYGPIGTAYNLYKRFGQGESAAHPFYNMPIWENIVPMKQESVPTLGRDSLASKLDEATQAELGAIQGAVASQLAQALRRSDLDYAQRGMLRSGRAGGARRELELGAMGAISQAAGSTALERFGLAEQASQALRTYNLQRAQLEAGQSAANAQMISGMFQAAAPFILNALFPGAGAAVGMSTSDMFLLQMLMNQGGGLTPQPQLPLGPAF